MLSSTRSKVFKLAIAGVLGIVGTVGAVGTFGTSSAFAETPMASPLAAANDLSLVFRQVGKKVEPTVVNIKVHKTMEAPGARRMPHNMPPNMPMDPRRFFDQNGDGEPDSPDMDGNPFGGGEQIGTGSGVIMEVDGKTAYIVTNNHVADSADQMEITLNDGRIISNGKLVGNDPKTDVAVIKIEADNLVAATWGNSDELEKGEWILAFGSPFGYVGSMTHGVVSALNRSNIGIIPEGYESFIQVDAPINPGNSGGPLVNIHGEVVGINTAIASRSGGFQGIGFAIPSNQVKAIYTSLRTNGKVVRGWLGVGIASVSEPEIAPIAKSFGYTAKTGVLVQETFKHTPAYGKLQDGDIITKLNGKPLNDVSSLRNQIATLAPGIDVTLNVFREGKPVDVVIKLGDQPTNLRAAGRGDAQPDTDQANAPASPRLGVTLDSLSPEYIQQLKLKAGTQGAVVTAVQPGSPAARAGIRPGDVIAKVNTTAVADRDEAIAAIRKADLTKGIRLYLINREVSRFVFIQTTGNGEKAK